VERFGLAAKFGFMHLMATNLCLWVRTIIWESANDWIHHVYKTQEERRKGAETIAGVVGVTRLVTDGPVALGLRSGG